MGSPSRSRRAAGGRRPRRAPPGRARAPAGALGGRRIALVPTGAGVLERALGGDRDAYAELVREHQQTAFRAAYLVTGSVADAEDAAQEGFVKAWRALDRFRRGAPFRPWLLAIVVNEARNRRRHAGRQAALALRALDPRVADVEEQVAARAQREQVLALVAAMGDEDRLAIGCRYFLGLSEEETADALGWPAGTVKSRLSRALGRLRQAMEEGT